MSSTGGTPERELGVNAAVSRIEALLEEVDALVPRLGGGAAEVELSLLERGTELVEQASRHLEHLGQAGG